MQYRDAMTLIEAPQLAGRRKTVLVVEDDPLVRSITSEMIRELGYAVSEAPSAEAAMATQPDMEVDLLVADLGLPGISGDLFAAELKTTHPALGIVFVSGGGRLPMIGRDGQGPVMLQKPYGSIALATALREAERRA